MKSGSGLLNTIINNLPLEFHAPRHNFLGPGTTKLEKRLAHGNVGINPLDRAPKNHNSWYRDHKKTLGIVSSAHADLGERAVRLMTSRGMWLKTKLKMGLDIGTWIKVLKILIIFIISFYTYYFLT